MVCTRKTKTLVSTCVILSGMTNIVCLLYVGWVTNYIASVYVKVQEPISEKKLEEDKGDTLRIIERLDHLENVIKQHIQGTFPPLAFPLTYPKLCATLHPLSPRLACVCVCVCVRLVLVIVSYLLLAFAKMGCREGNSCSPPPVSLALLVRVESVCVRVCSRFSLSVAVVAGATWDFSWDSLSLVSLLC